MVEFWVAALSLTILFYVLLDGMDLGVGILFGLTRDDAIKAHMIRSISPVWDGNETWLVISAAILFGAFPIVYSIVLSAFYLPLILMLCGLIVRGVAFEFRERSRPRWRPLWDFGFAAGSALATFIQGCAVGAMVLGIPNVDGHFTGSPFFWAAPFPVLCGIGLCLGYALVGAGWLILKTRGSLRERARRQEAWLLAGVLIFLVAAFLYAIQLDLRLLHRWTERPLLAVFPALGLVGAIMIVTGLVRRIDRLPFAGGSILFVAAYGTLAASFLPYMIPFTITYVEAAAPHSSLSFLFWFAGIFVLPLTIAYSLVTYWIFRGKIVLDDG